MPPNNSTQYSNSDVSSNETVLNLVDDLMIDSSQHIVKINTMCILFHHLFGNLDQKLFAAVIDLNKKVLLNSLNSIITPLSLRWRATFIIYDENNTIKAIYSFFST